MARFLAFKQFGSLRPADEGGEAMLRKLKQGELVRVEYSRPRNIHHHRLFWALMSVVHDNLDHDDYPTVEDLADAVKISAGHRTRIQLPNGEVGFIPKSIKFHKMEQDDFSVFYERVCDVIAKHFLPGVTSEQLREEVETMIGIRTSGEARSPAGQGADSKSEPVTGTGRPHPCPMCGAILPSFEPVEGCLHPWHQQPLISQEITKSTGASGDMGGDTPSEASVVVQGAAVSPSTGAGEPDPQSAPPPANYSAPAWGNNSPAIPTDPIWRSMEFDETARTAPAGGDEARADVGPLPPSVGSPSPNLFQRYWSYISEFPDRIGVRDATQKFIKQHAVPPDPRLRNKLMRIEQIRLNVLAGVYSNAEGEEKARSAIGS